MNYQPTIGLEIHAALKTQTKMFCGCLNDPDPPDALRDSNRAGEHAPNVNVCPICLGHPGTLPTINKKAVEHVIRVGLAVGGTINSFTKFDRKNYFYPDLPKGYQISQYDQPIVVDGELNGVRIRRIHLEEDTGRLAHATSEKGENASLVDFNRAGIPLMELVTEPDIRSAEEAVAFARELQRILRYLGVSDADMEKGHLRIEPNVSLGQMVNGEWQMGVKTELKNINSFKAVRDAIEYEIKRQTSLLERGEKVVQETRGWNEAKKRTVSQRSKEEAHDYRYFPEPDLPSFAPAEVFDLEDMRRHLPELPAAKRVRFLLEYGVTSAQSELLAEDKAFADYFEEAASEFREREAEERRKHAFALLVNYLTSDLRGFMSEQGIGITDLKVSPEHLAHLVDLIADGKLSSRQAKDMLRIMSETGEDPETVMRERGFSLVTEEAVVQLAAEKVASENPSAVADYKKGKTAALQFLVGKTMAELKGQGEPNAIRKALERLLK